MVLSQVEVTGAETYTVTIADKLIEKGHKVYIMSDTLTKPTKAEYYPVQFNKRNYFYRIQQIIFLLKFIKKNNIQIIHAHSRASGWVAYFSSLLSGIPLITTVHGKRHVHFSSKLLPLLGDYVIAVCENIKSHLIKDFKINPQKIEILRNGIEETENVQKNIIQDNVISIIGRLSGPKGKIAFDILKLLESIFPDFQQVKVRVIGGKNVPNEFKKFENKVEFLGYVENLSEWIDKSKVVFGSGRVAMESILRGRPTIAIGEACSIGLVTQQNIQKALSSNFGDIDENVSYDWDLIKKDLMIALDKNNCDSEVQQIVREEYDIQKIVERIESIYQSLFVNHFQYEIPILMYHRIVTHPQEAGKHGIYVTQKQFEQHMKYLKEKGFETITFKEISKVNRLDRKKKYVILTFDDGYEDNYTLLFPILRKYNFKAVIFLVSSLDYNAWDSDKSSEPKLSLLKTEQILEMQEYGIEFGSHTKTHPSLPDISLEEAKSEIFESKSLLEKKLGKSVISFAYPYGNLNSNIKQLVKEAGYQYGVATDSGPLVFNEDLYQIRRIAVFPNTDKWGFARKVKGNYVFKKAKK